MRIKSILLSMVAVLGLTLTSCEQDNIGTVYNQDNQGASFLFNAVSSSAPASNPIVLVSVVRSKTDNAATVNVKGEVLTKGVTGVTVAPSVSFEAGSNEGSIAVNLGPDLAVGQKVEIALTVDDADASIGGVKTTTLTAYKEYEWVTIGKGSYFDGFVCGVDFHQVEIMQAKGFPRYRVMDPYKECLTNDDGEWEGWLNINARCKYIECWVNSDDTVGFTAFNTGVTYDGTPIIAYPYTSFSGIAGDKSMLLDEKTIQLAPYYYVDGVGGWNYTQNDNVVLIVLP